MIQREGRFEFNFTSAKAVEKFDEPGKQGPQGMRWVDFVIEEDRRLIMVEVKDPSSAPKGGTLEAETALKKERSNFIKKLKSDTLIAQELTPKARDSYTYLHLMKRDGKPMIYVFVLGVDQLSIDLALLLPFKERLLGRLRKETDHPWERPYVTDCLVLTEHTWQLAFPQYPLKMV